MRRRCGMAKNAGNFGSNRSSKANVTTISPVRLALCVLFATCCASVARPPADAPPPRSAEAPDRADGIDAKSAALLAKWKERFDAERFSYTVTGPFVIAGDGGSAKLARYRDNTVLAAARALRATY